MVTIPNIAYSKTGKSLSGYFLDIVHFIYRKYLNNKDLTTISNLHRIAEFTVQAKSLSKYSSTPLTVQTHFQVKKHLKA